jgi:molybdenum cofactor cytidylyltransferase
MSSKLKGESSRGTIAGIVLAAGASSRMGMPKALLRFDDGRTLLDRQCAMLREAGCGAIAVVVGAARDEIVAAHGRLEVSWVENRRWELGQFSSVQAGVRHALARDADGALVLPVDVAGVSAEAVRAVLDAAGDGADAIVPEYRGRGGHPVWLSRGLCTRIAPLDPADPGSRLDRIIAASPRARRIPVEDPNLARNVNTMEEWEDIKSLNANSKCKL